MTVAIRSPYSPRRLKEHLDASGLSRADLARELGVSDNYVFQLCSGRRQMNERIARAIAYTLDISVDDLLGDAYGD